MKHNSNNNYNMKKVFTLSLAFALSASMFADSLKILSFGEGVPGIDEPDLEGLAISPNGEYICGSAGYGMGLFVASNVTGAIQFKVCDDPDEGGELRDVDNYGNAIGFTTTGCIFDFANGEETSFLIPEKCRDVLGEGITADGKMIVVSVAGQSFVTNAAYSFDRMTYNYLPVPTREEMGALWSRTDGSAAKKVSADGKVILGHMGNFGQPIIWTRNADGTYEYDFFPARYVKVTDEDFESDEKPLWALSAMYVSLSRNGRYAAFVALINDKDGNPLNIPVVYDVVNRTLKMYDEKQAIDVKGVGLYPLAIADDGTFVGCVGTPYFNSYGSFIWKAGEANAELFREKYPAYAKELATADELGFDIPTGMSADGRYIVGYTYNSEEFYDEETPGYYLTYVIDREDDCLVEDVITEGKDSVPAAYYSIDGQRRNDLTPGLNIVLMNDGTTRKVFVR